MISSVRSRWSLGLCLAAVVGVAGCFPSPLETPRCQQVPFEVVSQSGDTTITATGLRILEIGGEPAGAPVVSCNLVAVHLISYLSDGTEFLNTYELDQPQVFTPGLGQLIDGLEQGVIGMQVGGKRRLIMAPELAFGATGRSQNGQVIVPPNETVIYDVELLQVAQQF